MIFRNPILISIIILMCINSAAQVKFNKTFAGTCDVEGAFIQMCHDSGYVIAANNCFGAYVVRTNSAGDTLWTSNFTDTLSVSLYPGVPKIYCIKETPDHGFIMTGDLEPNGYCRKIDSAGNKLWMNDQPFAFPQNGTSFGNILVQDTGGYIIQGYSDDSGPDNYAFYFGITDSGDTTYTHVYSNGGGGNQDFKQTNDHGIILLSVSQNTNEYFLEKIGGTGGSWTRLINCMPYCILPTTDSGFLLGAVWSDTNSVYRRGIIKTDSLGDSLWCKDLGFLPYDIVEISLPGDSGYAMLTGILSGMIHTENPFCEIMNSDGRLVRCDLNGNIAWTKIFGGSIADDLENLTNTYDNGFSMIGTMRSESGRPEILFIKTDSQGNDH